MKRMKLFFSVFTVLLLVSGSVFAGSDSKVIAVINKADWCSTCEKNGERAMTAFKNNNTEGVIEFVANDVTNEQTKAKSGEALKKLGLDKAMGEFKMTGMAYFFDADSKRLIIQVSVAKSNEELAEVVQSVVGRAK